MAEIFYVIFLVAAMVGLAHLLLLFGNWLIHRGQTFRMISLLPLSGHIEEVEYKVRTVLLRQRMQKLEPNNILILVDQGMDMQTRDICEKMQKDFDNVLLCDDCQIGRLIEQGLRRDT